MSYSAPNGGNKKRKSKGVDTLLTIRGRPLQPGETVRFKLVKGPSVESSGDPVDSKAPQEQFPLIAKFGESVVRPNFTREPWSSARLYQQEIPKPVDDSDEEGEDGPAQPKKRRWRYAGDAIVPRQWILQENVDFLQTMVDRKEQAADPNHAVSDTKNQLSSRYEGVPEHNTSHYAMLRLHPSTKSPNDARLELCLLPHIPQNCMINFAQPAARKTYSLTEAEHVITDQRMGLVKTLHHMHPTAPGGAGGDTDPNKKDAAEPEAAAPVRNILALRKKAAQSSKGRLLNKLVTKTKANTGEEEDGDDVMGDVAFRNRKGGGTARKELLQTVAGDGGPTVSDEGVLGGTNDAAFGGRQRFAQLSGKEDDDGAKPAEKEAGGGEDDDAGRDAGAPSERGGDGAAMEEDFYQRDVKAEYDELDYDPNEQFDDDDVDLGEAEVVVENTGFGGEDVEEDEDEDDMDLEDDVKGAEGLASLAGFKALLAKARGETPPEPSPETASQTNQKNSSNNNDRKKNPKIDHMTKIMAAAEQSRLAAERRRAKGGGGVTAATSTAASEPMDTTSSTAPVAASAAPQAPAASSASEVPLVDSNGLRIISLETVRKEIWLNHGAIAMKRLMKIFDVRKRSPQDRQDKFRDIVRELCTMKADPINGRMLVLKQHYSKG